MKPEYREAFTEVYEIFDLMPQELLNKIPSKFRKMIEEERSREYLPNIKEPLEEQNLKDETIILLGIIYRDFLCSLEERKRLQEKDAKELYEMQQQVEKEMREKYNPDDLFKKKESVQTKVEENDTQVNETSLMVVQEEKWYKKIFNIIKGFFGRK